MNQPSKDTAGLERHAIAVLTMVIVALILWVGNAVQQTQVKLAAIQVDMTYVKEAATNDKGKFFEIEKRLDSIERQLQSQIDRVDRDNKNPN